MKRNMLRLLYLSVLAIMVTAFPAFARDVFSSPIRPKEAAPDFELLDMKGIAHRLTDYRGNVVILNFWATWCKECVLEIPSLNALSDGLKSEGLVVLGISIDRSRNEIEAMKPAASYPVLLDEKGAVFVKKYTVTRLPVTIIVDREGVVVERLFGRQDFTSDRFMRKITTILQGGQKGL